ncbi:hypothetical protein [Abditibacterium utsteinense]|uniref:hypothetical protein n=1 Tax=Abditibacterium utsteinense TaxID=1960156 RepID=UPI001300936D|nr:hypothetical protein [Abditibacterium utsteinense]
MKKYIYAGIAAVLVSGLSGCGGDKNTSQSATNAVSAGQAHDAEMRQQSQNRPVTGK